MFINNINPVIIHWNSISIRYYGVFLALGVILAFLVIRKIIKEKRGSVDLLLDLTIWLIIGGVIGARLGHIFFYNLEYYLKNPLEILFINHGGLSSHGLTIGLIITALLFQKIKKMDLKKYLDPVAIGLPLFAGFIRLSNFTNSEIVGRATNLPWAVKFPRHELNPIARHPSQIYEALTLFSIFLILYFVNKKYGKKLPQLFITHLFILLYFSTRFLIEFVKEYQTLTPSFFLTMGQWLSLPFVFWAVGWFIQLKLNKPTIPAGKQKIPT